MINYNLIRSKRKTIALYIKDGELEVRAPLRVSKSQIEKFIVSKEHWISNKLAQSQERLDKRESFNLNYGDKILLLGQEYPIIAVGGNRFGFNGKMFYMPQGMDSEEIKDACIKLYRDLARVNITQWVTMFSEIMGVTPTAIRITGAKTRWGSCSGRKSINFSWFLIMADREVVEYVIVHELAHIKEMNHSKDFWAIVESVLPDYRERKARLKELQKRLATESW